ncbi:MAG TPA: STN domain-containing protein [Planctomycetaceae bacterium]|nr:STN domain-containing protein [Planctomycetaceae bacterium]
MVARFCRALSVAACLAATAAGARGDAPSKLFPDALPDHYRTGRRFTTALEQPISASWKGVPLRSILRRLSHEREVSILLDRRVDPEQEVQLETSDVALRSTLHEIVRVTRLGVTQVGNCLIVAPAVPVLRLRTLIALRDKELERDSATSAGAAHLRTQRATIAWDDLASPAEILASIGRQFGLSIGGLDQIPHDLWAGATIPDATASEALSLVLNQFDLTFVWLPHEKGIRVMPIPARVVIERAYALHGKSPAQTLRILRSLIEGLDAESRGPKIIVRGTLEQHEMVVLALRGGKVTPQSKSKQAPLPIEKQSFMLQAGGVSLQELFEELKKQGLPLEYNAALLKEAGVDLKHRIAVDLPRLPATEFLTQLLEPHKLTFRIERGVVVISPKL